MKFIRAFVLLLIFGVLKSNATTLRLMPVDVDSRNFEELEMYVTKDSKEEAVLNCVSIRVPNNYDNAKFLGLWVELEDDNSAVSFEGFVGNLGPDSNDSINSHFCFDSQHKIKEAMVSYAVGKNMLITHQFKFENWLNEL